MAERKGIALWSELDGIEKSQLIGFCLAGAGFAAALGPALGAGITGALLVLIGAIEKAGTWHQK